MCYFPKCAKSLHFFTNIMSHSVYCVQRTIRCSRSTMLLISQLFQDWGDCAGEVEEEFLWTWLTNRSSRPSRRSSAETLECGKLYLSTCPICVLNTSQVVNYRFVVKIARLLDTMYNKLIYSCLSHWTDSVYSGPNSGPYSGWRAEEEKRKIWDESRTVRSGSCRRARRKVIQSLIHSVINSRGPSAAPHALEVNSPRLWEYMILCVVIFSS